jgi:hypothetical protein
MELYFNGDFIQRKVLKNAQSKPPQPSDERSFSWKPKNKRLVQSRAVSLMMYATRKLQSVFFLTFTEQESIESNKVISDFINNARKQKLFDRFIWVRERQKRGANHYHLVVTSKFSYPPVVLLQRSWNSAQVSNGGKASSNSFRKGFNPVVKKDNIHRVAHYIGKYMSKGVGKEDMRFYGNTRGLEASCCVFADDLQFLEVPVFKTIYDCEFFKLQKMSLDVGLLKKVLHLSKELYN